MNVNPLYVRQDIGKGNPIVLLHGLFADGSQWQKIAKLLSKDFRVIVVDLLGHGRSPRPANATYMPGEHTRALRLALEGIDATQNLTIVGYSMGGSVALSYAAEYPDAVEQLYLISSPFYLQPDQMIVANYASSVLVTKMSQLLYRIVEKLLGTGRILTRAVGFADGSKTFHKMIGAHDNKLDSEIIKLNIKNLVSEFDFAGTLIKVKTPTTFYAGKKDPFIVQGQLYALKKFNPYIDIQRLDIIKVDHMLVQNLPKEISNLISANKDNQLHVGYNEGKGDALVLLHGVESSSAYWKDLIPSLSEHRQIIAIDLLGFGNSPKPINIAYGVGDQVSALHKTLQSLNLKTFSLAGHSLGAVIALAYAGSYPKSVKDLTLFSPVLFPGQENSRKPVIKALQQVKYLPDASLFYQQTERFIGEDKLREYTPAVRSIENSINNQDSLSAAKKAKDINLKILYGGADPLVDGRYIHYIAKQFNKNSVTRLEGKNHNFAVFYPDIALKALDGNLPHKHQPGKASMSRRTFAQQIARLAAPILALKSLFLLLVGLLLFSNYAAETLVIGLSLFVVYKGYKVIKGAFSLKYEGLSYIGYILLGILTILVGWALIRHPQKSLEIGVFVICGLICVTGIIRIAIALAWTKSKVLTRSLLLTGVPMAVVGLVALGGSIVSIYIIIYTIAGIILFRSAVYGWYAVVSVGMAYIRSFNHRFINERVLAK